jgi:hypothetical protein
MPFEPLRRWRRLGSDSARGFALASVPPLAVALALVVMEEPERPSPPEHWFLIDVSRSMMARDVGESRLERARDRTARAVSRPGSRVGVVVFAGRAEPFLPLGPSGPLAARHLEALDGRTVIGGGSRPESAIDLLADLMESRPRESGPRSSAGSPPARTAFLLTDGEFTGADEPLGRSMDRLGGLGVRLVFVGIGDTERATAIPSALGSVEPGSSRESATASRPDFTRLERLGAQGAEVLTVGVRDFDLGALADAAAAGGSSPPAAFLKGAPLALGGAGVMLLLALILSAGGARRSAPGAGAVGIPLALAAVLAKPVSADDLAPVNPLRSGEGVARSAGTSSGTGVALGAAVDPLGEPPEPSARRIRVEVHARVRAADNAPRELAIRHLDSALAALRGLERLRSSGAGDRIATSATGSERDPRNAEYSTVDLQHDLAVVKRRLGRLLRRPTEKRPTDSTPRPEDQANPGSKPEGDETEQPGVKAPEGAARVGDQPKRIERAIPGVPLVDPGAVDRHEAARQLGEAVKRSERARRASGDIAPRPFEPSDR